MDASLASIDMNVPHLMQNIRLLDEMDAIEAAAAETEADRETRDRHRAALRLAAQNLSQAFLDLMQSAMPPDDDEMTDAGEADATSLVSNSQDSKGSNEIP
ncbi:unnamed protein product [Protopolystoma xenopodis]|uniref:Uncharacterized protein n=1 Tax=Protopolystoma xenopodis TaxID=117903 RepID=A0A448WTS6_9PLAT|nr:unnamed protein product [Protopolystoma xenopodis]